MNNLELAKYTLTSQAWAMQDLNDTIARGAEMKRLWAYARRRAIINRAANYSLELHSNVPFDEAGEFAPIL